MKHLFLNLTLSLLFAGVVFVAQTAAQSTILTMPSTDIMADGKVGFRLVTRFKTNTETAKKPFSSFVPRVIYGLRKDVEIGLNLTGNVQPGIDATTFVPTIKWRPYYSEEHHVAIVVGNSFYLPSRHKKYDFGSYTYAQASKRFSNGTKVTAGSYLFTKNVVAKNANRAGGQFAVEHPISKKVSFAADWLTGKHSSGYFTPGVKISFNPRISAAVGYSIGNENASRGNHYFYTSFGVNLF